MTVAEQDQVVDECFQCKLCYVNCPYMPGQHEWALDFPRLMMRAEQVLHRNRPRSVKRKRRGQGRSADTDLVGRLGSATAPLSNIGDRATPGSLPRKVLQKTVGLARRAGAAAVRPAALLDLVPEAARAWRRPARPASRSLLFPTCLVEYQDTAGRPDLVRVYERNGIECRLPEGEVCCGAPLAAPGRRRRVPPARREERRHPRHRAPPRPGHGEDVSVVVPQPTCGYVLKKDYVDYVGGADAQLVADHTYDAVRVPHEGAPRRQGRRRRRLDTDFTATCPRPRPTTRPATCGPRTSGLKSRDLIKLTGTKITLVAECSAHRRHVGPARGELRHRPQGRRQDGRRHGAGRLRVRSPATAPRQRRHHRARRARRRCTRSRSSPAPTASPRTAREPRRLTLDDIADLRAYERERAEFRQRVIALKKRRRIHVGPIVTVVFENRDTIRFQIQEMARVEKILTDEGIQAELRAYNPLIPEPGHPVGDPVHRAHHRRAAPRVAARSWSASSAPSSLRLGDGTEVRCVVDEDHESQLTRDDVTASVHYIRFELTPAEVEAFGAGPVVSGHRSPELRVRDDPERREHGRAARRSRSA